MSTILEPAVVTAADERRRNLQLALIVIAAGAIYPILDLRQSHQTSTLDVLHLANIDLGALYSIPGITLLVCYLPSGWLADRVRPRLLILFRWSAMRRTPTGRWSTAISRIVIRVLPATSSTSAILRSSACSSQSPSRS